MYRQFLQVMATVVQAHNVTMDELLGPCRKQELVFARQSAYYLLRKLGWKWTEIGRTMNRHHSTVISGVNRIGDICETEFRVAAHMEMMKRQVGITQTENDDD